MLVRERLGELIRYSGMSQAEIGRRIGEDRQWVNNRVLGKAGLEADDLLRLAEALNIDPAEFFRTGNPFVSPKGTVSMARQQLNIEDTMLQEFLADWESMTPEERLAVWHIAEGFHILRHRIFHEKHDEPENTDQ